MLATSAVFGFFKGFTKQLIAIRAIVAGAWAAFMFTELVCNWLQPYLHTSGRILYAIVFILMLIAVACLINLLGKVIHASINFVMLGWLDKLLGAIFSILKATLAIGLIIILLSTLNSSLGIVDEGILNNSAVYVAIRKIGYIIFPYLKELLAK